MLTPIEIQRRSFKSGLGYEKKDVDAFLQELLQDYETMYKENVELSDKINVLNEGLQYYKSIEKTLQKALVLAQRTSDETKEAAEKQAKAIEREAYAKADTIVSDARQELEILRTKINSLLQQYDIYKAQFKQLAAAQLEILASESFEIHASNLEELLSVTAEEETEKNQKRTYQEEEDIPEQDFSGRYEQPEQEDADAEAISALLEMGHSGEERRGERRKIFRPSKQE